MVKAEKSDKEKKPIKKKPSVKLAKKTKATSSKSKVKTSKFSKVRRRIRVPKYFRESWKEVRKVVWPNRRESLKLSFAVITFTIVFAIFTTIIDTGFSKLVERIFL